MGDSVRSQTGSGCGWFLGLTVKMTAAMIVAASVGSFGLSPVAASSDPGTGRRTSADVSGYPWSAIGKLYNGVGGACTVFVIGPSEALTAAHCLFSGRSRRFLPPSSIHVLLGYDRGAYSVHARVASYRTGADFRTGSDSDWALLRLSEPLPDSVRPLRLAELDDGADPDLATAGYGQERPFALTADPACRMLGPAPREPLLVHDCETGPGYSGAPLLLGSGAVVGIHVASGSSEGRQVRYAVPAATVLHAMAAPGDDAWRAQVPDRANVQVAGGFRP